MGRRVLGVYGWVFAAAGGAFALAAPAVVAALNLLAPALGAAPLEPGTATLWLALSGSLLATLACLAFAGAREEGGDLPWRAILLSKGVSSALFVLYAAAGGSRLFWLAALVDAAILAHVALERGREASAADGGLGSRLGPAPSHEAWFAEGFDAEGRGLWVRCYERREAGGGGEAGCFGALFEPGRGVARAAWSRPPERARRGAASPFELDGSAVEPGVLAGLGPGARWRVEWTPESEPLRFVPPLLHALGFGAGYAAPSGAARLRATAELEGRSVELDLRGCVGHVWGRRLPQSWRWAHARFPAPGGEELVLEVLAARPRVAGRALCWLTAANLRRDGALFASNSPAALLRNATGPLDDGFWFSLRIGGLLARGAFSFHPDATVVVEHASPDGRRLACRNSAVGTARLTLERDGREVFVGRGAACVETGRPA